VKCLNVYNRLKCYNISGFGDCVRCFFCGIGRSETFVVYLSFTILLLWYDFNFHFILPKVNTDYIRQASLVILDFLSLLSYVQHLPSILYLCKKYRSKRNGSLQNKPHPTKPKLLKCQKIGVGFCTLSVVFQNIKKILAVA